MNVRMKYRIGIGGKLLLAFGGITMLTVASALVGWYAFDRAGRVQDIVVNETVPFLNQALSLAEISHRIIASSPALTEATTETRRSAEASDIFKQVRKLRALLINLSPALEGGSAIKPLRRTSERIVSNLIRQNTLVGKRIRLQDLFSVKADAARKSVSQIVDLSGALVSNAVTTTTATVANLYEMVETPLDSQQIFKTLDRLIETEVDLLERMFELRHRSAIVGLLIGQLERAAALEELEPLQKELAEHLSIITRRVGNISDPSRKGQAGAALVNLQFGTQTSGVPSLISLRRDILNSNTQIADLAARNRLLSDALRKQVDSLVDRSRSQMRLAAAESDQALMTGNLTLLIIAALSLAIATLIAWFYVRRQVAQRIAALSEVTGELARGNLDVEVHDTGNDELSDMAGVLKVFKANALAKQRLEAEQKRTEAELRDHKQHLEQLVLERTEQLSTANERLSEEARRHEEARQLAEQASKAKSAFLAAMSHEIRTPITGILGTLHLLDDEQLSPGQQTRLGVIRASGETLLSIINDILDYSKIEAGHLDIVRTDFDLNALISDLVALMQQSAARKGLRLTSEIAPDVPAALKGDPGHIRQILINLAGNAIKFTDRGGVTIRVARGNGSGPVPLRFEVSDTGIGIPEKDQNHLFDAFYQAQGLTGRRMGGTGLGLSICARLVEAMNGQIGVNSAQDHGSTFWMELDFEPGNTERPQAGPDEREIAAGATPSWHVLLVEDNAVNAEITQAFLERAGHRVEIAASGEQALEAIAVREFDLALMDISLPGISGKEAARRIRALEDPGNKSLPVIAMSAHVFREDVKDYLAAGMNAFVGKPFTPDQLSSVMRDVMSGNGHAPVVENGATRPDTEPATLLDTSILGEDWDILGAERARQMVELFLESAVSSREMIAQAKAKADWSGMQKSAHSLKSAAGSLGLKKLFEISKHLEEAASEQRMEDIDKLTSTLPQLIDRSGEALKALAAELMGS